MADEQPKKEKKNRTPGQILERGKDKYLIRLFTGRDSTGKRHYFNETFHGKKRAAQDRLRVLLTKQKTGEPLRLGNATLAVFIEEWLKSHPDVRVSTLDHYQRVMNYYVIPRLGKLMLAKIEANDIQTLYADLAADGLDASTIHFVHGRLRSIFKLALARRKIAFNPMEAVKSPGGKKLRQEKRIERAQKIFQPAQVERFLQAANETRFGVIFTLAFHLGCRPGELLGLLWSDFDAQARLLRIERTLKWKRGGGGWYFDPPKTASGQRVLRLTETLVELLDRQRKSQLADKLKAGGARKEHGFIFADEVGEPYSQQNLRYRCKRILNAAGLPEHFNPYSARHTSATLLIGSGISAKTVSERLGHSDVQITLQTYTHPTNDMQLAASEQIEKLLKGAK